jgi:YidC/Oxa1 family membrane protein insertase
MERRVLLAIFLCFLVIYVWQALFVRPEPQQPRTQTAGQSSAPTTPIESPGASAPAPVTPPSPEATTLIGETSERDVRVETSDVIAIFTNRGGRLKSWRLKRYTDRQGQPLELVGAAAVPGQPLPFSLRVADAGATTRLNDALYAVKDDSASPEVSPTNLAFEFRDSSGLHAVKQFRLEPRSFVLTFRPTVTVGNQPVAPAIVWGPMFSDSEGSTSFAVRPGGLLSAGGEEERLAADAVAEQPAREGEFKYAGVDDHYFMSVALDPGRVTVTLQSVAVPPPAGSDAPPHALMAYSIEPAPLDRGLRFYVGPKDFNELAAIDRELVRAIHFGIWSFLVVPLLRSLNWINGYVGNYGWSIIVLTVIINLLIFPLRHKSVVAMRKMQEIQPEVKAIQDRYAKLKVSDPARQKMNQELMELYRQRGVNPAAGCVPMLLPFPVLLAFYSLLTTAIELRGAPFTLWIHDLSAPDPYYVTPILMGASQVWQQWIMPAAGVDPMQRRIGMIMPVVFTFLFLTSPSGIAIYWFASTLWGIGQQYFTNYWIGPPNIRHVRPPAERRAKRVGSGKTDAAAKES